MKNKFIKTLVLTTIIATMSVSNQSVANAATTSTDASGTEVTFMTQEEFEELKALEDSQGFTVGINLDTLIDEDTLSSSTASSQMDSNKLRASYLGYFDTGSLLYYVKSYSGSTAARKSTQFYLGDCTFINTHNNPVTAVYTQSATTTTNSSFSAAMSVSVEAKKKVLTFIEGKLGITGSLSYTTSKGTSYTQSTSGTTTVNPGDSLTITAYRGGLYADGTAYADVVLKATGAMIDTDKAIGVGDMAVNASSVTLVFGK